MLAVIEQLCDGTAALITAHPAPPIVRESSVQTYTFEWELASSPDALWPFVSNTEKMNRATGPRAGAVRDRDRRRKDRGSEQPATTGSQRVAGLAAEVARASLRVDRRQPARRAARVREGRAALVRRGGPARAPAPAAARSCATRSGWSRAGCSRACCRSWRSACATSAGSIACTRRLDRVLAAGRAPRDRSDRSRGRGVGAARARARRSAATQLATQRRSTKRAIDALMSYLLHASDQDVARIRPLELAQRFGVPEDAMIDACLHAAKLGVLEMVWDVICPSCRIPSSVVDSLQKIEEHGSCKACNLGFEVDFSPRDRARVSRVARDSRGRDAHVLHRRPGALPARRRAGPARAGRAVRAAAGARGRLLPRAQPAAAARVTSCASRASGGVRRVDITLGERARAARADRRRSAAHARQSDAARGARARRARRRSRVRADRGARDGDRGVPRAVSGSGARARPADGGDAGDARGRAARRRADAVPRARRHARRSRSRRGSSRSSARSRRSTAARSSRRSAGSRSRRSSDRALRSRPRSRSRPRIDAAPGDDRAALPRRGPSRPDDGAHAERPARLLRPERRARARACRRRCRPASSA